MDRLHETTSPDKKWKAWVNQSAFASSIGYTFIIRNNNWSLLCLGRNQFPRTRKVFLGSDYYDPTSQYQKPDLPIGQKITIGEIQFTPIHAELKFHRKYIYSGRPLQEVPYSERIKIA